MLFRSLLSYTHQNLDSPPSTKHFRKSKNKLNNAKDRILGCNCQIVTTTFAKVAVVIHIHIPYLPSIHALSCCRDNEGSLSQEQLVLILCESIPIKTHII